MYPNTKPLAVGAQFRLTRPAGAVLCREHRVISIPAGQVITIKGFPDDSRIVTAEWNGEEVFVFRQDLVRDSPARNGR